MHPDGGYRSRKLWFSLFVVAISYVSALTMPPAALAEVVWAYLGALAIYTGGNSGIKWIASRGKGLISPSTEAPEAPQPPPASPPVNQTPRKPAENARDTDGQELG